MKARDEDDDGYGEEDGDGCGCLTLIILFAGAWICVTLGTVANDISEVRRIVEARAERAVVAGTAVPATPATNTPVGRDAGGGEDR